MSYCRWSSDDFACDVYCYEDVSGGYTTHVAGNKAIIDRSTLPDCPEMPPRGSDEATVKAWAEKYVVRHKALMALMENAKRKPIGLSHDGESFNDPDLESFLERLLALKTIGYNVPDWVIESVREEIADAMLAARDK